MAVAPERTRLTWDYSPAPESADHVRLRDSYGVFVDGEFADPRRGKAAPTVNPATEEPHRRRSRSPARRTSRTRSRSRARRSASGPRCPAWSAASTCSGSPG